MSGVAVSYPTVLWALGNQSLLFLKKDDDGHIGLAIPVLVEKAVVAAIAIPRAGDHAVRENAS